MTIAFVYEYRIAGEQKVWRVRSNYDKEELRQAIEDKAGPLDLLMCARTAIGRDSRLPFIGRTCSLAATPSGSKDMSDLRYAVVSEDTSDPWDVVIDKIRPKWYQPSAPASSDPVSDSWTRAIERVTKQRKNAA